MLYHDKIDIREGINVVKSNISKECIIGHYWFFYLWVQIPRFCMQGLL